MDTNGDEKPNGGVNERLSKLEQELQLLRETVTRLERALPGATEPSRPETPLETPEPVEAPSAPIAAAPPASGTPPPPPPPSRTARPVTASTQRTPPADVATPEALRRSQSRGGFEIPAHMRRGEYWLNKVGIGLLLFGVAFGFKYSVDQGWLTPWIRVVSGLLLGGTLMGIGLHIRTRRRHFSQVLIGGAVATWYITGFSAFQLFGLVSYPVAFVFMIAVTALSLLLSLRQNEPVLALIGVLGGLGTPFLLYSSAGSLAGLVGYTCVLLAGTTGIYFFKGWRTLLWVSFVGGWIVMTIGLANAVNIFGPIERDHQYSLQIGYTVIWLLMWLVPVIREIVWSRHPERWPRPAFDFAESSLHTSTVSALDRHVHVLSVSGVAIGLFLSFITWAPVNHKTWGLVCLGVALLYGVTAFATRPIEKLRNLSYTQQVVALVLLALGLCLVFDGRLRYITLALDATALLLIARRTGDGFMQIIGHLVFGLAGIFVLLGMWMEPLHGTPLLNIDSASFLVVIAAACTTGLLGRGVVFRAIYVVIGYVFFCGLLVRDFGAQTEYILIVLTSGALVWLGYYIDNRIIRYGAGYGLALAAAYSVWSSALHLTESPLPANWEYPVDFVTLAVLALLAFRTSTSAMKLISAMAITIMLAGILERLLVGNALMVALTLEALLAYAVATRNQLGAMRGLGAGLMAVVAVWMVVRGASTPRESLAILNATALAELVYISALAALAQVVGNRDLRTAHGVAALCLAVFWLAVEFGHLGEGQAFVTISWGILGLAILILGLRWNAARMRIAGMTVLGLVVAKLFLVDLSDLQMIWRVLLFMGFGVLFLLVSYYFRSLWRPTDKQGPDNPGMPG